jgi:hypothetical protein
MNLKNHFQNFIVLSNHRSTLIMMNDASTLKMQRTKRRRAASIPQGWHLVMSRKNHEKIFCIRSL